MGNYPHSWEGGKGDLFLHPRRGLGHHGTPLLAPIHSDSLNTVVFTRSTGMLGVILEDNATVAQLRVENFIMNDYVCNIRR